MNRTQNKNPISPPPSFRLPFAFVGAPILVLMLLLPACGERVIYPIQMRPIDLPRLKDGIINLSVAHVVNPRFEKFSDAQVTVFLEALKAASKEHLGREIEFDRVEQYLIDDYFKPVPASRFAWRKMDIFDFKTGTGDRKRLEAAYATTLSNQTTPANQWAAFAAREIGLTKVDTDLVAWKVRLTDTHLQRLKVLASVMASDGKPVIDQSLYNEWQYWGALGEREVSHDVIITNQLVASADYDGVDIHTALRGGLVNGTTQAANNAQFGSNFWWSTFAYNSKDAPIVAMRNGEQYEPLDAARLAGTGAVHELGHMLYHYGHPFGVPACAMSPTPMLRFRVAVNALDAKACAAANDPAMKRGAVPVRHPVYAERSGASK